VSNFVRAMSRFVVEDGAAGTITITEGERVASDHPVVARFPEAFESEANFQRRDYIRSQALDPRNHEAGVSYPGRRSEDRSEDGPSDPLRSQAFRANERAEFLPEPARERMERELREDDDPDNRLARFITAAADRDYFRAFAKVLNDPVSGMHLWSPDEREAVQRVKTMQRSLTLSTSGTAGGFSSRTSSTRRSSSRAPARCRRSVRSRVSRPPRSTRSGS
jgi:hypothetical protein